MDRRRFLVGSAFVLAAAVLPRAKDVTTPKTIAAEYTRAMAAEKVLTDALAAETKARLAVPAGSLTTAEIEALRTLLAPVPPGPEPPSAVIREVATVVDLRKYIDDPTVDQVVLLPGTYNIGYFTGSLARPSSKPLLIRARDIPANPADAHSVVFTGQGIYLRNRTGSYSTWQGISFEGIGVKDTGMVVFGAYGEPGPDHVTFLDTRFVKNTPLNGIQSHCWYLSDGASHDILIDRYYMEGVGHTSFDGFTAYHNPLGANVTVRHGRIENVYGGFVMYGDLANFLAEDITINNAKQAVDLIGIQGTLRRVVATNIEPGYGQIKGSGYGGSGPIVVDACSGLPTVTA